MSKCHEKTLSRGDLQLILPRNWRATNYTTLLFIFTVPSKKVLFSKYLPHLQGHQILWLCHVIVKLYRYATHHMLQSETDYQDDCRKN